MVLAERLGLEPEVMRLLIEGQARIDQALADWQMAQAASDA